MTLGYWDSSLISESWDQNAILYPDREAVVDEGTRVTWSQAKKQIHRIALGLLELGLRGENLAVQLPNCLDLFLVRLACEKAGIVVVTIMPNFRQAEVAAILNLTEAAGIVIPKEFRKFDYIKMVQEICTHTPRLKYVLVSGDEVPEGTISIKEMTLGLLEEKYPRDYLEKTRFDPFEIFQIATTTGTTGMPKCVEFVSCVRQATGRVVARRLKYTPDDVVGAFAPVIAGGCFNEVYRAAPMRGAKIVLAKHFTPEEMLGLIEKERVTIAAFVPAVLIRILEYPDFDKYDHRSLRVVKHGGAALPYEQAVKARDKFECPVLAAYGGLDVGTISSSSVDDPKEALLRTVGRPLDGAEVIIVDAEGREVPLGETGEILVRGPHCEPGYYGNPVMTEEVWRDGWFHTGDLGSLDSEGRLTIQGRTKDMIIRGGQNIYPLEIESILLEHPKILNVAIIGMPDPVMGERACAYVVPGEKFNFSEMVSFLKDKGIAPFKIPERLEIIDDLPLAGGIKVGKKRLRQDIESKLKSERGWSS